MEEEDIKVAFDHNTKKIIYKDATKVTYWTDSDQIVTYILLHCHLCTESSSPFIPAS